jgi:hypothetical protein
MIHITAAACNKLELNYHLRVHAASAGVVACCCSISHHPGSSSSSIQGWFLITIRDPALPNSELRVAPVEDPAQQTVRAC